MSVATLFRIQLVVGYIAWSLCFLVYIWPWLKSMKPINAQRAIATLHSFRFIGLAFLLPGLVGSGMPSGFTTFAAYGDLVTGTLAVFALLSIRVRWLFLSFVVAFNTTGIIDLVVDYFDAIRTGLPAHAGLFGATYWIPIIYVPLLMITHLAAFYLLLQQRDSRTINQRMSKSVETSHLDQYLS